MSEKNGNRMFAPFDVIALKDIKDKTTKKPGLRPLFGCIESIQNSVDDIREYLSEGPEASETELLNGFLKQLTDMQVKLIEVTKTRVTGQNLSPVENKNQQDTASMLKEPAAAPASAAAAAPAPVTPGAAPTV